MGFAESSIGIAVEVSGSLEGAGSGLEEEEDVELSGCLVFDEEEVTSA